MRAPGYLVRKRALGALETSQTVNARTTDIARTVCNFEGDRRDLDIYIYIYRYIYIYIYPNFFLAREGPLSEAWGAVPIYVGSRAKWFFSGVRPT